MAPTKPIRFYDIPSKLGIAFSPNTLKTMYALTYKGIPFERIWVEMPDIENTCKSIGAPPTDKKADGSPLYTLPVIHDPNTGETISDSFPILEYLEKTYPSPPEKALIPLGTTALQKAFIDAYRGKIIPALTPLVFPRTLEMMNPPSENYYRRTRELALGKTVTELEPKGEKRVEVWKQVEAAYGAVDAWIGDGKFVMGDRVSSVDFDLAGIFLSMKLQWGEDNEEWKSISSWHGGRWTRLLKELEAYEKL
ncbi:hypothetical protein Moror_739 [Moniliophthora roreri MCA 2997]|uniref:GST N-terminal domain-containing protein n=2 Tax=Moniliophthora roreri TaxID=221103 RepID=V2WSW6_MONRO|nr:hypothetical protein Moror_739 [Moniliophthora roreri MCA 2997]KAI3614509.1 hypothetical protein WG66_009688 [Moniliophthora roreri]